MKGLFETLDLLMGEKCRHAQQQAESGNAPERYRDIDHAWPADRFKDEPAQYPVHEQKKTEQILRNRIIPRQRLPKRRRAKKAGKDIGRQSDEGAPDHPPHTLIVQRRLATAAAEQDP